MDRRASLAMTGLGFVIASAAWQSSFCVSKVPLALMQKAQAAIVFVVIKGCEQFGDGSPRCARDDGAGFRHCERSVAIHALAPRPNMDRLGLRPRDDGAGEGARVGTDAVCER